VSVRFYTPFVITAIRRTFCGLSHIALIGWANFGGRPVLRRVLLDALTKCARPLCVSLFAIFSFPLPLRFLRYITDHDQSKTRWDNLDGAMEFWYRQSPRQFEPQAFWEWFFPGREPADLR